MTHRIRLFLFALTGLCVPLYAFPLFRLAGKHVDLASILAVAFVVVSLPALSRRRLAPGVVPFVLGAAAVPLLALLTPRPAYFSLAAFATSYAHWLLVAAFFAGALTLSLREGESERLVCWNVAAAVVVAAFGLYQALGIPRHWPGTGLRLLPIQREDFRFMQLGTGYVRPTSFFLEPAWLGGYLSWCLALTLASWVSTTGRRRLAWGGGALVLGAAAVATVSLGTLADLLVVAVVFGLTAARTRLLSRRVIGRALAAAGVLLLVVAVSPVGRPLVEAFVQRYRNLIDTPRVLRELPQDRQESSSVRFQNVGLTLEIIRSRPLLGIGLGQFRRYLPPERRHPLMVEKPWCGWLAIAAEMGVLGPTLLGGALLLVLARAKACELGQIARLAVATLVALAVVQQLHTGSFIDLWWWYPVALAGALAGGAQVPGTAPALRSAVSSVRENA